MSSVSLSSQNSLNALLLQSIAAPTPTNSPCETSSSSSVSSSENSSANPSPLPLEKADLKAIIPQLLALIQTANPRIEKQINKKIKILLQDKELDFSPLSAKELCDLTETLTKKSDSYDLRFFFDAIETAFFRNKSLSSLQGKELLSVLASYLQANALLPLLEGHVGSLRFYEAVVDELCDEQGDKITDCVKNDKLRELLQDSGRNLGSIDRGLSDKVNGFIQMYLDSPDYSFDHFYVSRC